MDELCWFTIDVDGETRTAEVHAATTQASYLGLYEGCGEGVCGACTVTLDGRTVRACLLLAVQAGGCQALTIRSLTEIEGAWADENGLTPLQQAIDKVHALKCGWCIPGLLVGTAAFLKGRLDVSDDELLRHLTGHLCRCTGSAGVVAAVRQVLAVRRESPSK